MANKYGYQFGYSPEAQVWKLYGKVTIGATGAPTLVAASSRGFASITRDSAGLYTIVLSDVWPKLLNASFQQLLASGLSAAPICGLISETVATPATKDLVVQFADAAGAAADPDDGVTLYIELTLKNSSV